MARALVVDDEKEVRELYAEFLELDGRTVVTAADGVEAKAMMRDRAPDVVLTDIVRGDCDGLVLIRFLRTRWPNVRTIAMSGGGRHGQTGSLRPLEDAVALGADATVAKPIEAAEPFQAVRHLAAKTS